MKELKKVNRTKWLYQAEKKVSWLTNDAEMLKSRLDGDYDDMAFQMFKFKDPVEAMIWRSKNDWTNDIMVNGARGNGKSNVMLALAKMLNEAFGFRFDEEFLEHVYYQGKSTRLSVFDLAEKHEPYQTLLMDEIHQFLSRYRASSTQNVEGKDFFAVKRDLHLNIIATTPSVRLVDGLAVDELFDWRINVYKRDKVKKRCYAIVEFRASSRDGWTQEWIEHSKIVVPYVNFRIFKLYQQLKDQNVYRDRTTFAEKKKLEEQRRKKAELQKQRQKLLELVPANKEDLSKEELEQVAIQLFLNGATKTFVQTHLEIGYVRSTRLYEKAQAIALKKNKGVS